MVANLCRQGCRFYILLTRHYLRWYVSTLFILYNVAAHRELLRKFIAKCWELGIWDIFLFLQVIKMELLAGTDGGLTFRMERLSSNILSSCHF